MTFTLTQKDILELKYWASITETGLAAERMLLNWYSSEFGLDQIHLGPGQQVLEIGCGPWWGLLPRIDAHRHYGLDPLLPVYEAAGLLQDRQGFLRVDERFELWDTGEMFDLIVSTNALDHGALGFHLLPRIASLLRPGGRLLLHVHLRQPEELNLLHDHCLTIEDFNRYMELTDLDCVWARDGMQDPSGFNCLIGEWVRR